MAETPAPAVLSPPSSALGLPSSIVVLIVFLISFCLTLFLSCCSSFRDDESSLDLSTTRSSRHVRDTTSTGSERKPWNCAGSINPSSHRARKEIALTSYVNKLFRGLFLVSGLRCIFLSVILDMSFNHRLVRFAAVGVLAPTMNVLGILASGWFPRVPLRLIAFAKKHGLLKQVRACSPWHDNVVTDFSGYVCKLEPVEQNIEPAESVRSFLYGDQVPLRTSLSHSTTSPPCDVDDVHVVVDPPSHDLSKGGNHEPAAGAGLSEALSAPPLAMATSQESAPNSSAAARSVVQINPSNMYHTCEERSELKFLGPAISGFPLKVEAVKTTAMTNNPTFELSYTFRNKGNRRMYLAGARLQNLFLNMGRWRASPFPIVVDESSDVLHCQAIEEILWELTKTVYMFRVDYVEHRFLAGLGLTKLLIVSSYASVSLLVSLIPLLSDRKSYFFLFFLVVLVPYVLALRDTNPLTFYLVKSLLCPVSVKLVGYHRLYKSRSSFRWCNEFRKRRIHNPTHFWIEEEYANTSLDAASCVKVMKFLELPDSPPNDESFTIEFQIPPAGALDPAKRMPHDFELRVMFDSVKLPADVKCYTNVVVAFFDGNHPLGELHYQAVEVRRLQLVEQLFHCFSDPSFGGYVEKICPRGYCTNTFVAHSPRFIDLCHTLLTGNPIPRFLVASRMEGVQFVVRSPALDVFRTLTSSKRRVKVVCRTRT